MKRANETISPVLARLGVSSHLLGHQCLKHTIHLMMDESMSIMQSYEETARELNSTVKSVEHACRYAIHESWARRDTTTSFDIFGNNEDVPTVNKFVKGIVRYLKGGSNGYR